MKPWVLRVVVGVFAVALAAGPGGKHNPPVDRASGSADTSCEASAGRITIATHSIGGVAYALGGELAHLISKNTKLRATVAETGGSGQNIQQLMAGDYDIAFVSSQVAFDAVTGTGLFDKPQGIRALARLYQEYVHVLVRADAGIESVRDLRDKRISTGTSKSATEIIARQLLRAAGLDPDRDVQTQRLDLAKTADGLKAGTIDALIWVSGLPTPKITEITTSLRGKVRFLDATPLLGEMNRGRDKPVYEMGFIPASIYQSLETVPVLALHNLLLVREDFPVGAACAITKLIFEEKAELETANKAAKDIRLETASQTGAVPLHPGARQALDALHAPG